MDRLSYSNVREHEVDEYLRVVERHASGLLLEMRKDEYEGREDPVLNTWMQGGLDYIMLQFLNVDSIRTIGSVLGQSITLDYYGQQGAGVNAYVERSCVYELESYLQEGDWKILKHFDVSVNDAPSRPIEY